MSQSPLVSIVIPTYKSASFIEACVDSILLQTYPNIEIVIVDDGSPDHTIEIIKKMKDPRMRLICQENSGRGMARNNGFRNAKGQYVAFLDHDDLLMKGSIEERVSFLEGHSAFGWVFTDAVEFDETGDLRLYIDQFPWLDLQQDSFIQLLKGCFPLTSTVMIHRPLLERVGGFNTQINYGDDIELFLRLFLISRVGMIRKPLTRRRIHHSQGVSSTYDRWNSRVKIYKNFQPSQGKMSTKQKAALSKALKHAYFKIGEYYWQLYERHKAQECFVRSIGFHEYVAAALGYYLLAFLPTPFLKLARKVRRKCCELPRC